ncbi:MAG: ion transporter [Bryobacterales bacterium]|nr:ion transporter [Bryobacterales bacterium]
MQETGQRQRRNVSWRRRLYVVIFESNTRAGRIFDVVLLVAIVASVLAVSLESVAEIQARYGDWLRRLEWIFTALFTAEYALRLYTAPSAARYARSFFGVVDLLAIVPSYVSILVPGAQSLLAIRALRLIRVFRILKLGEYLSEAEVLGEALRSSRPKITVFLTVVLTVVVLVGSAMYLVEGPEHGFTSIPRSMYWTVVTLTTVGYGDIAPETPLGQFLASLLMILGYGIIAVPTGIVSVELARAEHHKRGKRTCQGCGSTEHDSDARHCKHCGSAVQWAPDCANASARHYEKPSAGGVTLC